MISNQCIAADKKTPYITPNFIDDSWYSFITPDRYKQLENIEKQIGEDYTSSASRVPSLWV